MLQCSAAANCEEDNSQPLLTFDDFESKEEKQRESILSIKMVNTALSKAYSIMEKNVLEYLCGYFFKKLLQMHKSDCENCQKFGAKVSVKAKDAQVPISEVFLYLKVYNEECHLYKCQSDFVTFIGNVIKISLFVAKHFPHVDGVSKLVENSCKLHLNKKPKMCSTEKMLKLIGLISRTIFNYHIKWLNSSEKKQSGRSQPLSEQQSRKLSIITHQ